MFWSYWTKSNGPDFKFNKCYIMGNLGDLQFCGWLTVLSIVTCLTSAIEQILTKNFIYKLLQKEIV